jgi:hypothetical protein
MAESVLFEVEEMRVLIEWYPFPLSTGNDDTDHNMRVTAQTRISQLSYLLLSSQKPSTLHTFDSIGYLEHNPQFGLVFSLPPLSSPLVRPVTLFDLLAQRPARLGGTTSAAAFPYPTLEQRYHLAAVLASSLYTFMLARWHHKRFVSSNIAFLFPSESISTPDLSHPFVGGFALSRPDGEGEISIVGSTPEELDIYLHPDLRGIRPPQKLPNYIRAYDIYSFGILLVEIGFWNTLPSIAPSRGKSATPVERLGPQDFREKIVKESRARLGCWMGERYRAVTLRCLNVCNEAEGGIGEELGEFYWGVVLPLIECAQSE